MNKEEKIKVAITAGVASVILLILVLFLSLSGRHTSDEDKMNENITDYAGANQVSSDQAVAAIAPSAASTESSEENSSEKESGNSDAATLATQETTKTETKEGTTSGNGFYVTENAVLKDVYKGMKVDIKAQMMEMYTYWSDGNTEAVRDLAHLERYEVMSYSLSGSKDFYYYGEMTGDGVPNGKGLAIYADDQYYFGDWVEGVRSGKGTWISFYPSYSKNVVTEHMYSGDWADDLPCGNGQEHFDYDAQYMNESDYYLQNAIGGFKDGYYNGDMYIITVDKNGNTYEWDGKCTEGTWEQVLYAAVDKKGKIPVLSLREDNERHIYMTEDVAQKGTVSGIITGGSIRK